MTRLNPLTPADKGHIALEVAAGRTMADVARTYEVSRERVRQICHARGITARGLADARRQTLVAKAWRMIQSDKRLSYITIAKILGVKSTRLRRWLMADNPEEWRRWGGPPSVNSSWWGHRCPGCGEWKPWSAISSQRSACRACSSQKVSAIIRRRNVTEPTVTERRCPHCGETKPAEAFARNRRSVNGLQTRCRACQQAARAVR